MPYQMMVARCFPMQHFSLVRMATGLKTPLSCQLGGRRNFKSWNEGDVRWCPGLPGPPASPQAGFRALLPPPACKGD